MIFDKSKFEFLFVILIALYIPEQSFAQLTEECKLEIGTNMAGLVDYGTEIPFVDLMKSARTWYTKDIGNPNAPFDSGHTANLSYRPDGYPTHMPQNIAQSNYPQKVVTIWAITDGWTPGQHTILWDGTGTLSFWGSHQNMIDHGNNRITFDYPNPIDGVFEMTIETSDINDPIHNIRVLMPGSESTYLTEPFNPVWLEKLLTFKTVRFMDWGQTNNWGETNGWNDPSLFDWSERSQMDHYTWAYEKGVPYEMMIKLMNDFELDGWVCVPHRASNNYMLEMANLFYNNLDTERHLTVEYSNEIWNWIFGQTQWVYEFGCVQNDLDWPAGIVPYVQNCLDQFTTIYANDLGRITRAVGAFTGYPAITDTIVSNLTPGSFDAIAATFYFGLDEDADAALDVMGDAATANDIAFYARENMTGTMDLIRQHKTEMADPRNIPLIFYEGGQHLTGHPFGVEPTYGDALLEVQRDPVMYDLYNEWFDSLRTIQVGEEPLQLSHFSLVSQRSARYGSWGMLESMNQDTNVIAAPKYSAIINNMAPETCFELPLSATWDDSNLSSTACSVSLNWTQNAVDTDSHFEIERSVDGMNYQTIGYVNAEASNESIEEYTLSDNVGNSGKYYYRIKVVGELGNEQYFDVQIVEVNCNENVILIYPNPAYDQILVELPNVFNGQNYFLTDGLGKIVDIGNIQADLFDEIISIDISNLIPGVYFFYLAEMDKARGVRFVKM